MNQQEKFNETVGILVKAYMQGTLIHGNCQACAVGNLVAAKMDYKMNLGYRGWLQGDKQVMPLWFHRDGDLQREAIGYSKEEVKLIEAAFEAWGPFMEETDLSLIGSLLRVVDVLADIHGIDLDTAAASKALFVKA